MQDISGIHFPVSFIDNIGTVGGLPGFFNCPQQTYQQDLPDTQLLSKSWWHASVKHLRMSWWCPDGWLLSTSFPIRQFPICHPLPVASQPNFLPSNGTTSRFFSERSESQVFEVGNLFKLCFFLQLSFQP